MTWGPDNLDKERRKDSFQVVADGIVSLLVSKLHAIAMSCPTTVLSLSGMSPTYPRRFRYRGLLFSLTTLILISLPPWLGAQEAKGDAQTQTGEAEKERDEVKVTVSGQFVPPAMKFPDFDIQKLNSRMIEIVEFRQPELPGNWSDMTPAERQKWISEFEQSDAGKALIEANNAIDAGRLIVELVLDNDGKFVAYDVPRGRFVLEAAMDAEVDGKVFKIQTSRQFEIGAVDEVALGTIDLEAVRFLRMGDVAPEITGNDQADKPVSLGEKKGKFVLLNFVVMEAPGFPNLAKALKDAASSAENAGKLSVFTIALDNDKTVIGKSINENGVDWPCLDVGGWNSTTLADYGVRTVPSLWLIDAEGKIVLTGQQFIYELSRTGSTIGKLTEEILSGRMKIGQDAASGDSTEIK